MSGDGIVVPVSIGYTPINSTTQTLPLTITSSVSVGAQGNFAFNVWIKSIVEINSTGGVVKTVFNSQNSTVTKSLVQLSDSSTVGYLNFTFYLPGNTTLLLSSASYSNPEVIYFAGLPLNISQNGIVFTIQVLNWLFDHIENHLILTIETNSTALSTPVVSMNAVNAGGELHWLNLEVNNTNLYAKFPANSLVDDSVTNVVFSYINPPTLTPSPTLGPDDVNTVQIQVTIPSFWDFAEIAMNFAVLQRPSQDNGNNQKWYESIPFIATLPSVFAVAVIIAIAVYLVKNRKVPEENELDWEIPM